jgi:hypothetical protein
VDFHPFSEARGLARKHSMIMTVIQLMDLKDLLNLEKGFCFSAPSLTLVLYKPANVRAVIPTGRPRLSG